MSDLDNVTAVPPAPAGTPTSEDKTMSLVAHLLGIVSGFIGALVIWLINKDKAPDSFVVDQSKEALNFQITIAIAYVICMVLTLVIIGAFLLPVVGVLNLIFCIIGGIKANSGVAYRYPFALRLIK